MRNRVVFLNGINICDKYENFFKEIFDMSTIKSFLIDSRTKILNTKMHFLYANYFIINSFLKHKHYHILVQYNKYKIFD